MAKIIFFIPIFIYSVIFEINKIEELIPHVDSKTWVFFDIDDTLFEAETQFGRAKWYWWELQQLKAQGIEEKAAHQQLYPRWIASQNICKIRPIESDLPNTVSAIQNQAAIAMGLTARHPPISETTLRQLHSLSIDFSDSAPLSIEVNDIESALYTNGVWFLSDFNPKGVSVRKWLENLNYHPPKIVFIDDSRHHLENMEKELLNFRIEFIGFHYTKAHERPFDPEVARIQAERLFECLDANPILQDRFFTSP